MDKIAIITLYGYINYGNRFQNYAIQELLKKYDFEVDTIVVRKRSKIFLKNMLEIFKAILGNTKSRRYLKLWEFSNKYIQTKNIYTSDLHIDSKYAQFYSYFVVGSDQVWNPYIRRRERDNFFLRFTEQKQRICLAPSFGVDEIPKESLEDFKNGLMGFDILSSREKTGLDIILKLTGRKAKCLIDPTLVLNKKDWHKLFEKPTSISENYIVVSFLGEIDTKCFGKINSLAQEHKLNIINVMEKAYSPGEILYMLSNASLVCTDSFHFSAFSINFNTPFIVFRRKGNNIESNMFSRLSNLLELFKLGERVSERIDWKNPMVCDFERANEILENERDSFFKYLDLNLKKSANK